MGKIIYNEVMRNEKDDYQPAWNVPSVTKTSNIEVWWDIPVKLPNRVKHNRPDMIIWDKQKLQCKVIDFSVPLDDNVPMKETEKINNYIPMISERQQMYRSYKYEIIPIVIGTLGAVSTSLKGHLESMGFKQDLATLVRKLQNAALIGSVKTVKTVLGMKK